MPTASPTRARAGRRHRPALVGIAAALVVATAAAGCSATFDDRNAATTAPSTTGTTASPTTTAADPPEPVSASGFPSDWTPPPLDWAPCSFDETIDCATLTVPLDWSAPEGPTIDLALGRINATGDRIGSLVTNPGGPGGSGLEYLAGLPLTAETGRRFDTVSWDPRGVGRSRVVDCDSGVDAFQSLDSGPDDQAEQDELDRAAAAISAECGRDHADVLAHVGTADVARDLEAIRRALGNEPLNYVGFSYGTRIGQDYAARFPGEIRSMVLDGVVDPTLGFTRFLTDQAVAFERAFLANSTECAAAGLQACGVDDLVGSFDRVTAAAEAGRVPGTGGPIGPSDVVVAATFTGYLNDGWRELGPALAAAEAGDGDALRALAQSYWDFGGYPAYAAVVCTDDAPPADPAAFREFAAAAAAASPRFGAAVANEMLPCATWPVEATDERRPEFSPTLPPIVVVGSTGDPATPFDNAVAVAERIPNAVLLTVESDGHTAYGGTTCVDRAVDRYLVDLVVPPAGTTC
ncbi:MAG: alpha/beta hydrolase [Microthrixaceae bacterium]